MSKLSAEQRVKKAHVWLMKHPTFCLYSGIFMLGKTEVRDDLPTAATNGRDKMYGRAFIESLSDAEIRALVLHENMHVAFRHLTMWRHLYEKNPMLANMACDFVINLLITDDAAQSKSEKEVTLPKCGLLDNKYRGWDAQRVYNDLLSQATSKKSVHVKTVGNPAGMDVPVEGGGSGGMDEHDWDNAEGMSETEKEALIKDVDQALRQGKMLVGKLGGSVNRSIDELLQPTVDWRAVLREFITSFCDDKDMSTWRKPSRRWIGQDVYMPTTIGESVGPIVVAVDTSGSIGLQELTVFLSEVKAICESVRPESIELLYWDSRVAGHETYKQGQLDMLVASTKPAGGGGTSPSAITSYMRDKRIKAECAIVLSDGYVGGDWGGMWPCPVLWAITSDVVSDVGKTVRIN